MNDNQNIITQIKRYLEKSPVIQNGLIKSEYLLNEDGEECEYSIDPVAENPIVEKHVEGTMLRQFVFNIATKQSHSIEVIRKMLNTTFGQELIDWIIEENEHGNLPEIDGIEEIEPLLTAHAYETSEGMAKCQLQVRILYTK